VLNVIAHLPTSSLTSVATDGFFKKMTDAEFMRLAVLLAHKGYQEGGCPIGGVIIGNQSRQVLGKGHNTLVQENHPITMARPLPSAMLDGGISARQRSLRP
jgi:cytosine/creatinine deaminase